MFKRYFVFAGVFLLLVFLSIGGIFVYSSSPSFCRSCHNMEPYYQSWHKSKHNSIACTTCHFDLGIAGTLKGKFEASNLLIKYITNTYSPKPFANIKDASCLQEGCHIREKLGKTKLFLGKASFNHQPHFKEGLQSDLTCTSCHSPLSGKKGKHISVNESHCYLCHLQSPKEIHYDEQKSDQACVLCHKELPKIISLGNRNIEHEILSERKINCNECHSHVVKGTGSVAETTCFKCHDFVDEHEMRKDIKKLHKTHTTAHVECYLCHENIKHRIDKKAKMVGSDCRACHIGKHSGAKMLYSGRGGIGVKDRPGPMYKAGVDCIGCHDEAMPQPHQSFQGKNLKAVKKKCVECHNDKRYGDILDQWKFFIKDRLDKVNKKLEKAHIKIRMNQPDPKMKKLLQEAMYN